MELGPQGDGVQGSPEGEEASSDDSWQVAGAAVIKRRKRRGGSRCRGRKRIFTLFKEKNDGFLKVQYTRLTHLGEVMPD